MTITQHQWMLWHQRNDYINKWYDDDTMKTSLNGLGLPSGVIGGRNGVGIILDNASVISSVIDRWDGVGIGLHGVGLSSAVFDAWVNVCIGLDGVEVISGGIDG